MGRKIGLILFVVLSAMVIWGNAWGATPQIAAGGDHTVALKSDGTLWAWGSNLNGELGDGSNTTGSNTPVQVVGPGGTGLLTGVIAVATGGGHCLALRSDGTLWAWGYNYFGQLGDGSNTTGSNTPVQVVGSGGTDFLTGVIAVAAGGHSSLALKSDGTVWAWGDTADSNTPVQVVGPGGAGFLTGVIAVATGGGHSLALRSDGTLWAWGYNGRGQLGNGSNTNSNTPVQVVGPDGTGFLTGVIAVAAGYAHSLALKSDGTLWAWGYNLYGQLGDGSDTDSNTPLQVVGPGGTGFLTGVIAVATGPDHSFAIKSDGTLWAWGYNYGSQLGDGSSTIRNTPVQVIGSGGTGFLTGVIAVATGANHSLALKSDGTLWAWGYNGRGQLGNGSNISKNTPVKIWSDDACSGKKWVSVATGGYHSLAIKSDGTLWAWGYNLYGQLGNDSTIDSNTPQQIGNDNHWVSVAAGRYHSLALKSDGTLWTWGWNNYGILGDGTTIDRHTPQRIGYDTNWVSIAAGYAHSLALKSDGTLWTWGIIDLGELGWLGTSNVFSNTPQKIGSDTNWVSVAAGYAHSLALKSDGTLWAWGWNYPGQLGDGTNTDKWAPVKIGSEKTWVSVAAGMSHSLALKSDGTLWTWGGNTDGQLGDGSTTNSNTPQQIGNDTNWVAVAAGGYHSLALKSVSTLWAWGYNSYGQLGDGSTTNSNTPQQIGNDTNWVVVAAGDYHSLALKSISTLWAWGYNSYGQLGDGSTTNSNTPVKVTTNCPPVLDPIGDKSIDEGVNLTFSISGSDPNEDTLTFSASGLAGEANFDAGTKTFYWTPDCTQAGLYSVTFTVSDGKLKDEETVGITVNDALDSYTYYSDADGDGYSDGTSQIACSRPTGYKLSSELTATSGDCNDNDAAVNPGATEVCDNVDNDCDGSTDESLTQQTTCGVGACSSNTGTETCTAGGWGGDTCDPYAGFTTEVCDNVDNDCDGSTDEVCLIITVVAVKPNFIPQGAVNQPVTITGSNFTAGATVSFSGAGMTVNSVTFVDSTQLVANLTIASNAATGLRDVTVTNPDGGSGTGVGLLAITSKQGAINNMIDQVNQFLNSGQIDPGTANSLLASLNNAGSALAKGNNNSAKGILGALINKLNAFEKGGQITSAISDKFVSEINALLSSL